MHSVYNVILPMIPLAFVGVAFYLERKVEQREKKRIDDEKAMNMVKSFDDIRGLERIARKVCKKATNSPCNDISHFVQFSKMYARSLAVDQYYISPNVIDKLTEADTEKVDEYREQFNMYFCRTFDFDMPLDKLKGGPQAGDFESFLTFHWAINMTNAIIAEKGPLCPPYNTLGHKKDILVHKKVYDYALQTLKTIDLQGYDRAQNVQNSMRTTLLDTINDSLAEEKNEKNGTQIV